MKRLAGVLLLLLPATLAMVSAARAPATPDQERNSWNRPIPEWWKGPVRYALTDAEMKEYRSLDTSPERAAFIARFWASRDPDPYTPGNEAERTFWQRVSAADELFGATTVSGWRTDRGWIYIVLGPPDEITSYNVPSVAELDPTHSQDGVKRGPSADLRLGQRGAVEWVYRSLPSRLADAGQSLTFVKDETGEYRLSRRLAASFRFEIQPTDSEQRSGLTPPQSTVPADSPIEQARQFEGNMRSVEDLFSWGQSALFEKVNPSLPAKGRVSASEFFGVLPVKHRLAFFQAYGGTSTLLTLAVPCEGLPTPGVDPPAEVEIFGSLEKEGDPSRAYQFSSKRKLSDPTPTQRVQGVEHRLYEVRGVLPPGDYRLSLGARLGDRVGTSSEKIVVPDFQADILSLGGPVLAEQVGERTPEQGQAFSLGQIRMIPKLDATYEAGSNFGFYFQIYHSQVSLSDGRLHLNIEYSVAVREKGIFRPLGKPVSLGDNPAPNHAYLVPLKGWAAGEYLLTVTVGDRVGGQVVAATAAFQVQ